MVETAARTRATVFRERRMVSHDLPWLLDGAVRFARYRDGFVTISGFAYGECRFTVVAIADAE